MSGKITNDGTMILNEGQLFQQAAQLVANIQAAYAGSGMGGAITAVCEFEVEPDKYFATLATIPDMQRQAAIKNLLMLAQALHYLALIGHFRPSHRMTVVGPSQYQLLAKLDEAIAWASDNEPNWRSIPAALWEELIAIAKTVKTETGYKPEPPTESIDAN